MKIKFAAISRLETGFDMGCVLEKILVTAEALCLTWADGLMTNIPFEVLRRECPCAECSQKRKEAPSVNNKQKGSRLTVIEATKEESVSLENLWKVGTYALGLRWKDGHDSGIYTYQFLFNLSEENSE